MFVFLFPVGFMAFIILLIILVLYIPAKKHKKSRNIVYSFKQNNDNPTITELVQFHKKK